jgi:hypothetical protein
LVVSDVSPNSKVHPAGKSAIFVTAEDFKPYWDQMGLPLSSNLSKSFPFIPSKNLPSGNLI